MQTKIRGKSMVSDGAKNWTYPASETDEGYVESFSRRMDGAVLEALFRNGKGNMLRYINKDLEQDFLVGRVQVGEDKD
jgi:hypothetical protein